MPRGDASSVSAGQPLPRQARLEPSAEPGAGLAEIARFACRLCRAPIALIARLEPGALRIETSVGLEPGESDDALRLCAEAASGRHLMLAADLPADARPDPWPEGVSSRLRFCAAVPLLRADGDTLGVLAVMDRRPRGLETERQELLVSLGPAAAAALREAGSLRESPPGSLPLEQSEEQYRALVDGSIQGIVIQRGYIIHFVNAALARMLGYDSPDELVGVDLRSLVGPVERERLESLQSARDRGEPAPSRYEVEGIRRDGSSIRLEVLASPVRWRSEHATMGTMLDVTERYRAEQALRESQRTLRAVIDAVPAMISAKDATLRYVFMNRIHAEVHSVSADESVGRTETEIRGPEAAGVEALDQEVIESGQPCPFREEPHRNGQGIVESWLTTRVPIKSADGRPSAVVTIGVNITERKRLEEELRQAQKMESVGRLAGGVAHDFNNLLTVITGRAELLLGRLGPDSPARRELELIRDAGERGAALTQQLLAFSRKQVLQPSVLDLNAVLADLEPMLRRLLHETIDLVVGPGAARATVRADRGQLEQVVFNLVINAQDAMPEGGRLALDTEAVVLEEAFVARHGGTAAGPHVVLSVSDTGYGMSQETRAHIFEPFFTTKQPGKGTGLGLATVYGIVKQSGGLLSVDSEEGRGAVFRVYLPAVELAVGAAAASSGAGPAGGSAETILVVEDAPAVRTLVKDVLERAGYRVVAAEDPEAALSICARPDERLDLLLTDVVMPGMSGGELGRRVQLMRPGIRVLYMSGYPADEVVHHGVRTGDLPLLAKPFTPETIARAVRQVLDAPVAPRR